MQHPRDPGRGPLWRLDGQIVVSDVLTGCLANHAQTIALAGVSVVGAKVGERAGDGGAGQLPAATGAVTGR